MKKKNIRWGQCILIMITAISAVVALGFTVYGLCHLGGQSESAIVTYVVALVSFFISCIALYISVITYYSIDAVNNVTSMEGNVLQNENYSVSYPEMIDTFSKAKKNEEYVKILWEQMNVDNKGTNTCIEFADWIQRIIDNLIWFAYVGNDNNDRSSIHKKLIETLEKENLKYSKLSNGIQYTLNEHIKLIDDVFSYIEWSGNQNENKGSNISRLENIRAGMMQNPVSKTVYYDYLGLHYHKKAKRYIFDRLKPETDPLDITKEYYVCIDEATWTDEDMSKLMLYLERALNAFNEAEKESAGDLLWLGYILYNKLRVTLMLATLKRNYEAEKNALISELDHVVKIRENVKYLFADDQSYIGQQFQKEIDNALSLRKSFITFMEEKPKQIQSQKISNE